MLANGMIKTIHQLKEQGYSKPEVVEHLRSLGEKVPSAPTLRKYYNMKEPPENPREVFRKDKVFDCEPYRETIIQIVSSNPRCNVSSVYDVLTEKYVDSGDADRLPGNEQTLRNYIKHLKDSGKISEDVSKHRTYDYVFDTPPGDQMLIDFGQIKICSGFECHFICLLLRYSRVICVFAQDHKYDAEEACRAIYRGISKLGGRPIQLVIDQDSVFINDETYGEIIETQIFGNFIKEQDLKLWVCNKADPESKGPIENVVGFVKKNYFSARKKSLSCIEDVTGTLSGWVRRKNKRIHQATFRIPEEVFAEIEKDALRPVVPSVYESSPLTYKAVKLAAMPYVQYLSSKYSVPREYCFKTVHYKACGEKLYIYDANLQYICEHQINACKGSINQLDEHKKPENEDWMTIAERMRAKWNCMEFQHFINGFKKENPRHLSQQLFQVEQYLDSKAPGKEMVTDVINMCCDNWRYKFSQFKVVFELIESGYKAHHESMMTDVQKQDLSKYGEAFKERCGYDYGESNSNQSSV